MVVVVKTIEKSSMATFVENGIREGKVQREKTHKREEKQIKKTRFEMRFYRS